MFWKAQHVPKQILEIEGAVLLILSSDYTGVLIACNKETTCTCMYCGILLQSKLGTHLATEHTLAMRSALFKDVGCCARFGGKYSSGGFKLAEFQIQRTRLQTADPGA